MRRRVLQCVKGGGQLARTRGNEPVLVFTAFFHARRDGPCCRRLRNAGGSAAQWRSSQILLLVLCSYCLRA